jgi:nucleotide-binding universal stress UspA family protein
MTGPSNTDTIVVGVDGSENGRRALVWALDEARHRDGRCHLVHAVDFGLVAASTFAGRAVEELREAGESVLESELEFARQSGVPVDGELALRSAAQALIDSSRGAAMLVVGSRGHGGFAGLLLGSVSSACTHHATCPVVVVPPPERAHGGAAQTSAGRSVA